MTVRYSQEIEMKTITAVLLGLGLFGCIETGARSQDKKEEKKDQKVEIPKLEGKYTLVSGKKDDAATGDDSKKWDYSFTPDKITVEGSGLKFVFTYKLDPKTNPINIEMEIIEGPEGTKGSKASGIVEVKGETLKLAYSTEKDKRPKNFDGKEGFMFEFKKAK
jgi:uncharacterized protein (TIGR03067 family)